MSDDAHQRSMNRNALTAVTFVEIVDTLVDDFDVIDVLTVLTSRSVELLEAAAAGILLADTAGHLRVMAASTEQIELLELFQIQNDEGPCLDCFNTGRGGRPRRPRDAVALAAVRDRERRRRVPVSVRRPAPPARRDPRLPEPVHVVASARSPRPTSSSPRRSPMSPASPSCRTRPHVKPRSARANCSMPSTAASRSNRPRA